MKDSELRPGIYQLDSIRLGHGVIVRPEYSFLLQGGMLDGGREMNISHEVIKIPGLTKGR
jgi:hypothetical protein